MPPPQQLVAFIIQKINFICGFCLIQQRSKPHFPKRVEIKLRKKRQLENGSLLIYYQNIILDFKKEKHSVSALNF